MTTTESPVLTLIVLSYLPKWQRARERARIGGHLVEVSVNPNTIVRMHDGRVVRLGDLCVVHVESGGELVDGHSFALDGVIGPNGLKLHSISLVDEDKAPPGCIVRKVSR